ncbi:MAG: carboxypeptidase regulatory-like domain-containing protein [Planctomycetes bacterium]|nr:carboxypeptidase regulatory-like domain-containing protein [Planctomycetota bacterium]
MQRSSDRSSDSASRDATRGEGGRGRLGALLLVLLLATLLATAIGAWWLVDGSREEVKLGGPTGASGASDAPPSSASGRDARSAEERAPRDAGTLADATTAATRAALEVDPLALPTPAEIDAVEREGQALFWGRVLAPDGTPCAGATLWHDGREAGESDALGRYRIVVAQRTWDAANGSNDHFEHWLHARKEGVGVTQAWCQRSGPVDLLLRPGYSVSGRTVARGSAAPLPGMQVELHVPLVSPTGVVRRFLPMSVASDAAGAFRFDTLMGARFALRAGGGDWASDGWFEFDVDPQRGRSRLDFELEPLLTAKGWFTPWPPPGFDAAAAAGARVVALVASSQALLDRPESAAVAEDGAFAVRFAATGSLELRLEVGGASPWSRTLDLPWEPAPVDLGRIELQEPARVTGRVALPPELLELGFELVVVQPTLAAPHVVRVPLDAEGRFTSPPLAPGPFLHGVALGEELAIAATLRSFDPQSGLARGVDEVAALLPGELRDLGTLAPSTPLLAGRIARADGSAAFDAVVELAFEFDEESGAVEARADREGRYVIATSFDEMWLEAAEARTWRLVAHHHGARGERLEPSPPTPGSARRIDVALDRGAVVSGRVVDAGGAPLAHARFLFFPTEWRGGRSETGVCWSDREGRFEIAGLAPVEYSVLRDLLPGDGESDDPASMRSFGLFGRFAAPAADVTLKPLQGDREE